MLFQSFAFFLFFCGVYALYWGLRNNRARAVVLLLASCAFYMSWGPWFILVTAASTSVDFVAARRIEASPPGRRRRFWLWLAVGLNLALLVAFKYSGFLADQAAGALHLFGVAIEPPHWKFLMPLGISFYTFEAISYVTDVYRGRIRAERNPLNYALFIMFFPHLISGPIIRAGEFLPQVRRTKVFNPDRLVVGAQFFLLGLFKKIVIADRLALVADPVFAAPGQYNGLSLWLGLLAYSVQVYCDFSGYSDMAVGLAHAFGYRLPENFRMPYFAPNIAELWQRWHITLSHWLRDYVYAPLRGARSTPASVARGLVLTMTIGGLWHGAGWTFIVWGFYHGVLLAAHRWTPFPRKPVGPWLRPAAVALTYLAFCVGLIWFRSESLEGAWTMLTRAFRFAGGGLMDAYQQGWAAALLGLVFVGHLLGTFLDVPALERRLPAWALGLGLALAFLLTQLLAAPHGKAFIYFQF